MAELLIVHTASLRSTFDQSFRGKGDTEGTRNVRLKLVTFNCDLGLKSDWLSYGFHTLSH